MRLLYLVDGRSPIALNWIRGFQEQGHEVHLVSTFPCEKGLPYASLHFINVGLSQKAGSKALSAGVGSARLIRLRTALRHWLAPLTLAQAAGQFKQLLEQIQPELVHAMRIPYEGMVAARADPQVPLIISIWGNDFTLHAGSNPLMARETRRSMEVANAIHADCDRDLRLAVRWNLQSDAHRVVLPGNGGIRMDVFHPGPVDPPGGSLLEAALKDFPPEVPVVINPRGFRGYVRNDIFFQSIPLILAELPGTRFLCPAMLGQSQAAEWIRRLGIDDFVRLLPALTQGEMAAAFRRAAVSVSPSEHDGTPNTLLEAMASGSFPVAGDLESVREWIQPGINGSLVDPGNPAEMSRAVVEALRKPELRASAVERNLEMVAERAEYNQVMNSASAFYQQVVR
jgi:glycosyltransferase involved in cell wall biosynthesis